MENFDDTEPFFQEANLPKGLPFNTPEGYFDSLAEIISSRIAILDFEGADIAKQPKPFEIPENYFTSLTSQIENKISQLSLEETVTNEFFENQKETILSTLNISDKFSTSLPFEVPSGYFENLTSAIEANTSLRQKKRVQIFSITQWAYAAAAAIVLSVGIIYYTSQRTAYSTVAVNFNTDSLSTSEIVSMLNNSETTEEELISHIDVKEFPNHLSIEENDLEKIIDELDESDLIKEM